MGRLWVVIVWFLALEGGISLAAGKREMTGALRRKIRNLKGREKTVELELRRLKASGEGSWKSFKADLEWDMDRLKGGYNELLEAMKVYKQAPSPD